MIGKQRNNSELGPTAHNNAINTASGNTKAKITNSLKLSLLLGVISFLVYANTLRNGYVLDDDTVIKENTIVTKGMAAIPELLSTPYRHGYFKTANDLYRPLSLVSFAIEYQVFGLNPTPSHFFNVLLFAGCVILLFKFLDQFFEGKRTAVAFIAGLLFALHPVHTEVVANVKSRDELLCFFFAFLSLNTFFKYTRTRNIFHLIFGSLCFLLSLLSKETSISFLAIIPLIFFFYSIGDRKSSIYITISSVVIAIVFLTIRTYVLTAYNAGDITNVAQLDNALAAPGLSYASRIATAIYILGFYLRLLFVPWPLICDYSFNTIPYTNFADPLVLLSLAAYIFLAAFGIIRLLRSHKDPFAFCILFFLISISLFSNIPFLIGATMGERFLFFGSVAYCLIVALFIENIFRKTSGTGITMLKNKKTIAVLVAISAVYATITVNRNRDWSDNLTLFSEDIKKAPGSAKLNQWLGSELLKNANTESDPARQTQIREEAVGYENTALSIIPDFAEAHFAAGSGYLDLSKLDLAEIHEKRAVELDPTHFNAINGLAAVYYVKKEYPETIALCKRSIELSPGFIMPHLNIGFCYIQLRKFDSAIVYLRKVAALDPNYPSINKYISICYMQMGNITAARKYEAMEQRTNPEFRLDNTVIAN